MKNSSTTIWTPAFISLFLINIIIQMGLYMMNSLVSPLAKVLGAGPDIIGIVASLYGLTALCMSPINGPAYDSFKRKKLLSLATGAMGLIFILYACAPSVPILMAARVLHGIAGGCVVPLCLLLASDALPEDKLGSGIGVFSLAQCAASAVAPGIGMALAEKIGYAFTFFVGSAFMFVSFLLTAFLQELPREKKAFRISLDAMISRRALVPGVFMFFIGVAYICIQSFIIVYAEEWSVSGIALYFTVYAVGLMIVQPTSGKLADKLGVTTMASFGVIVFTCSLLVLSIARNLSMFIVAAVVASIGYGAIHPTMQALTMKCAEEGKRGAASNTYYTCMNFSMIVGPILAGKVAAIYQSHGHNLGECYSMMYRWMSISAVCALVFYFASKHTLPQKKN